MICFQTLQFLNVSEVSDLRLIGTSEFMRLQIRYNLYEFRVISLFFNLHFADFNAFEGFRSKTHTYIMIYTTTNKVHFFTKFRAFLLFVIYNQNLRFLTFSGYKKSTYLKILFEKMARCFGIFNQITLFTNR